MAKYNLYLDDKIIGGGDLGSSPLSRSQVWNALIEKKIYFKIKGDERIFVTDMKSDRQAREVFFEERENHRFVGGYEVFPDENNNFDIYLYPQKPEGWGVKSLIYLGGKKVQEISLGDKPISEIYLGDKCLFQKWGGGESYYVINYVENFAAEKRKNNSAIGTLYREGSVEAVELSPWDALELKFPDEQRWNYWLYFKILDPDKSWKIDFFELKNPTFQIYGRYEKGEVIFEIDHGWTRTPYRAKWDDGWHSIRFQKSRPGGTNRWYIGIDKDRSEQICYRHRLYRPDNKNDGAKLKNEGSSEGVRFFAFWYTTRDPNTYGDEEAYFNKRMGTF